MTVRKIFAVALVCILMFSVVPSYAVPYGEELNDQPKTYEQKFTDVPSDNWAFTYVAELVERGAIAGYPDGTFRPGNTVTRAEFAKIMTVAAGLQPKQTSNVTFSDVPATHWAHPFLEASKDFMTGYKVGNELLFKPDNSALREDIAVAVVKLKGYDISVADLSMLRAIFKDYETISENLRPYVAVAVEKGIVSGYPDETFRAQATVTRAEAAAMLWRAFQYGNEDKIADITDGTAAKPDESKDTEETQNNTETAEETQSSGKAWSVTTIAQAAKPEYVNSSLFIMDNRDNLYWVSSGDIMTLNAYETSAQVYFDISKLDVDTDEYALSDFYVSRMVYDDSRAQLLIDGFYMKKNNYSGNASGVFVIDANGGFSVYNGAMPSAVIDGEHLVVPSDSSPLWRICGRAEEVNGVLYFPINASGSKNLTSYNYLTFSELWGVPCGGMDILNGVVYAVNPAYGDNVIFLYNFSCKELGRYTVDDIEIKDKKAFSIGKIQGIRVTSAGEIVYYDDVNGVFRMISPNA